MGSLSNNNPYCNRMIKIMHANSTAVGTVRDKCPGCVSLTISRFVFCTFFDSLTCRLIQKTLTSLFIYLNNLHPQLQDVFTKSNGTLTHRYAYRNTHVALFTVHFDVNSFLVTRITNIPWLRGIPDELLPWFSFELCLLLYQNF